MNNRILVLASLVFAGVIAFGALQTAVVAGDIKEVNELILSDIQPGPRFQWPMGGTTSGAGRWVVKGGKFETPGAAYYKEDSAPAMFIGKLPDDRDVTLQWSPQTTHVIIGKNILKGVVFDGDPSYPLVFRLISGKGYVYMCGKGTIASKSGPTLRLGAADTVERWLPLLSSKDPMRAEAAAMALGFLAKSTQGKDKAVPALIAALDSSEFGVRWSATEALGRLQDARALTPLLRIRETGGGFLPRLSEESLSTIPGSKPYVLQLQLLDAAKAGDLKSVTQLLESGANINGTSQSRNSPLLWALYKGHREVAELLLKKGADINASSEDGETPLSLAAYQGYSSIVELMLSRGVNLNTKSNKGNTPLHLALFRQHADIARFLINKGADVTAKGENGFTPLHTLVNFNGQADVAELLLAKGADVSAKSSDGVTL